MQGVGEARSGGGQREGGLSTSGSQLRNRHLLCASSLAYGVPTVCPWFMLVPCTVRTLEFIGLGSSSQKSLQGQENKTHVYVNKCGSSRAFEKPQLSHQEVHD